MLFNHFAKRKIPVTWPEREGNTLRRLEQDSLPYKINQIHTHTHTHTHIYIYIYIYIYILGQVFLKTMEHCLLYLISIFQVFLFFLCRDPGGKEIDPYLLSKRFRPYFWSSSKVEDIEQFLYHLDPNTRKITRRPEKLQLRIINSVPSSLIKPAFIITSCLNIFFNIYIYIYICVCVCVCVCVCIILYSFSTQ